MPSLEDVIRIIEKVGFPALAFLAILWMANSTIKENTNAINQLKDMIQVTCKDAGASSANKK